MDATYFALFSLLFSSFITADLLVTLQHGGQLRGKSFDYDGQTIGLFLGVRYAAAPTGSQRFRKPSPPKPWSGTIDAISASSVCVQKGFLNPDELIGDEDCLFMDITVPGGVDPTNKKPVMVWIHGGGYMFGSKDNYIGASLAKHGDVIVVTINYRVDVLGFLFNGPGTGNFGLWDQRAALVWIQDNIQRFGGDPDLVTIFGESAGGGSVSAQLLGQHNDGLFKRGIQQSGSLYTDWGWYTSERQWKEIVEGIKEKGNCQSSESVYDCLSGLSLEKIYALVSSNDMANNFWHPMPDNDFFSSDVMNEDYALSRRFDLLSGFNGQEGAYMAIVPTFVGQTQESIENGLSESYVDVVLDMVCQKNNKVSFNLCKDFFITTYLLDSAPDDKQRGLRLSYALGEFSFNADIVRGLEEHSSSTRATYAYHFVEPFQSTASIVPIALDWLKKSAFHGDDLPFVFGYIYVKENNIREEYFGSELSKEATGFSPFFNKTTAEDKPLVDIVMTIWTNFAKSGNPSKPVSLPESVPEWPEFDRKSNQFMELGRNYKVVTTPQKERLELLTNTVMAARQMQVLADKGTEAKK